MLDKIFKSSKKIFYIFIFFVSIISLVIFLISIKSNNRKFNQNLITSTITLFSGHLENLNKNNTEIIGEGNFILI